nr:uncharacterized protein LOC111395991 [Ipomoea batatas]
MAGNSKDSSEATVSRTLGSTDSFSDACDNVGESNIPMAKEKLKTPWVDLFKPSCEKGKEVLRLNFYEPVNGGAVIQENELLIVKEQWAFALLGCFAGRFPGVTAIQALVDSWKVQCKWSTQPNDHVLFRFNTEEDRCSILSKGGYSLFGKPLFLKSLPEHFHLENKDFSILPIWVQFPLLPSEFWGEIALSKIASCIGKPLWSDDTTKAMKKGGYARVLVEIDTSFHPLEAIPVSTPTGYSFSQEVYYELPPCFCTKCRSNDHYKEECNGKWKNSRRGRKAYQTKGKRGNSKRPHSKARNISSVTQPTGSDPPISPSEPLLPSNPELPGLPCQSPNPCDEEKSESLAEAAPESELALKDHVNDAESGLPLKDHVNDGNEEQPQTVTEPEPASPTNGTSSSGEVSPIGTNVTKGRNVLKDLIEEVFNEANVNGRKKKTTTTGLIDKSVGARGETTKSSKGSQGYKAALLSPSAIWKIRNAVLHNEERLDPIAAVRIIVREVCRILASLYPTHLNLFAVRNPNVGISG